MALLNARALTVAELIPSIPPGVPRPESEIEPLGSRPAYCSMKRVNRAADGAVVHDYRLNVLHDYDANDLALHIESDHEVERRAGEADDICQFSGREQKADGAPGGRRQVRLAAFQTVGECRSPAGNRRAIVSFFNQSGCSPAHTDPGIPRSARHARKTSAAMVQEGETPPRHGARQAEMRISPSWSETWRDLAWGETHRRTACGCLGSLLTLIRTIRPDDNCVLANEVGTERVGDTDIKRGPGGRHEHHRETTLPAPASILAPVRGPPAPSPTRRIPWSYQ